MLPYSVTPDEIDYIFSTITKTLPSILDPYETPKLVGGALAEIMPTVSKERPEISQKLSQMRGIPLESVFRGCMRAGFPLRVS